ncbi:MAG: methylamine utilization protein MauJ [Patescibacteria group bacterium]
MKLNYLFNTNAVLINDEKPEEIFNSHIFRFLDENIIWKIKNQGSDIVLEVVLRNLNYAKKIEKLLKFASVVVYRNSHVNGFRYVTSSNAEIGQIKSEAGIETRFLLSGNEDSFSPKMWSMLSFYLEARNSTSNYYKFICLYKIIEIQNLKSENRNGKKILVENNTATQSYIETEIKKIITRHELNKLQSAVKTSSIKPKTIGKYFEHIFRDAFAHTGFLTKNNYINGFPTLNPTNFNDARRYQEAVVWFDQIAKTALRANEPSP